MPPKKSKKSKKSIKTEKKASEAEYVDDYEFYTSAPAKKKSNKKKKKKTKKTKKSAKRVTIKARKRQPWHKFEIKTGSRRQVWNGTAYQTSGRLQKSDLKKNPKTGRIVSRKRSELGKRQYKKFKAIMVANQKQPGEQPRR